MNNKVSFSDTAIAFTAQSDAQLRRTYWLFAAINKPWMVKLGTGSVKLALKLGLPISWIMKPTVYAHFCGGEDIAASQTTVKELGEYNIGTILDYSVEGEDSEPGYEAATEETLRTIDAAKNNPTVPFSVFKVTGLGPTHILEKVQAKAVLTDEEKDAWQRVQDRVERICQRGHELGIPIFIDAEETWLQETIDRLANQMMARYNTERAMIYNTYQMYAVASLGNLQRDLETARKEGYYLGVKLVRGAYMEKERDRAEEKGYPDPIQPTKADTDKDFNAALTYCMDNLDRIYLCAGSHNEDSNALLMDLMAERGLAADDPRVYFAQLYGMSDHISFPLATAGYNVAKYVPYGPVKKVMPYLFRRAEENTSVAGQSGREFTLVKRERARRRQAR